MIVKIFSPEFRNKILSGEKTSTIRPTPKGRRPEVGEAISLREWKGRPYRSKQRELNSGTILMAKDILIDQSYIGTGKDDIFTLLSTEEEWR